jgi:hypothetical protein
MFAARWYDLLVWAKTFLAIRKSLSEVVSDGSVDKVLFGLRRFATFA